MVQISRSVRKEWLSQKIVVEGTPIASMRDRKPFEKLYDKIGGQAYVILFANIMIKTSELLLPVNCTTPIFLTASTAERFEDCRDLSTISIATVCANKSPSLLTS
jgi:hypothetical protein